MQGETRHHPLGALLKHKRDLIRQYLCVTACMCESLKAQDTVRFLHSLQKRRAFIRTINGLDQRVRVGKKKTPESDLEPYEAEINQTLKMIGDMDREIINRTKTEGEKIKTALMKMGRVKRACKGYRPMAHFPRFLDKKVG